MKKDLIKTLMDRRDSERRDFDRDLKEKEIAGKVKLAETLTGIGETLKHLYTTQQSLELSQKEFGNVFDKHIATDNKRYTDVVIEMNFLRGQNKYWYMIISILGGIVAISSVVATVVTLMIKFAGK